MIRAFDQTDKLASSATIWLAGALCLAAGLTAMAADNSTLSYNRDIRPVLSENCFPCHGTDSAARKAGLRLDLFETATSKLEDGAVAIVPGKPAQSEMIRRIN